MLGMMYIIQKLRLCTRNDTTQAQQISHIEWITMYTGSGVMSQKPTEL